MLGLKGRLLAFGLVHQSNSRGDPLPRSWGRVYAMVALENGPFVLQVKPCYRIPDSAEKDDNPDIKDYIGSAEFLAFYKWQEQGITTRRLRTTFKTDPSWGSGLASSSRGLPLQKGFRAGLHRFALTLIAIPPLCGKPWG